MNKPWVITLIFIFLILVAIIPVGTNPKNNKFIDSKKIFKAESNRFGVSIVNYLNPSKETITSFSTLDDYLLLQNEEVVKVRTNLLGNLNIFGPLKLFNNSSADYMDMHNSIKITNTSDNNIEITKIFKIKNSQNVKFIKNGIKFSANDIVFDNNGWFYSQNAPADLLSLIENITGNQYYFAQESFFNHPDYVGIISSETGNIILIKNQNKLSATIDPKYNLLLLDSPAVTNKNEAKTTLVAKIFESLDSKIEVW